MERDRGEQAAEALDELYRCVKLAASYGAVPDMLGAWNERCRAALARFPELLGHGTPAQLRERRALGYVP